MKILIFSYQKLYSSQLKDEDMFSELLYSIFENDL